LDLTWFELSGILGFLSACRLPSRMLGPGSGDFRPEIELTADRDTFVGWRGEILPFFYRSRMASGDRVWNGMGVSALSYWVFGSRWERMIDGINRVFRYMIRDGIR
jgi:hypothetical protein